MFRLFGLVIIASLSHAASAAPTPYESLADAYTKGGPPTHFNLAGYWAGTCYESSAPEAAAPAVFVHKIVEDAAANPVFRPTISYFTEPGADASLFEKMTPKQVEKYGPAKEFFDREQWQMATVQDGALTNHFDLLDKVRVERAVRLSADEFQRKLLLRVSRVDSKKETYRYCQFTKFLGLVPPLMPLPTVLAQTGAVANERVRLENPVPTAELEAISLVNGEGRVWIRNIILKLAGGGEAEGPKPVKLNTGEALTLKLKGNNVFQLVGVEFYVRGDTSNIELRGQPSERSELE